MSDRPLRVSLDEIDAQPAKGWPDFHPEDYCHRCGNPNVSWFTLAENWNPVMRGGNPNGWGDWQEIICMPCFIELARPILGDGWTLTLDENGTTRLDLIEPRAA